jgi:hypothetical protein
MRPNLLPFALWRPTISGPRGERREKIRAALSRVADQGHTPESYDRARREWDLHSMAFVAWLLARVDQLEDLISKAASRPTAPPPRLPPPLPRESYPEQEISPEVREARARRLRSPNTGASGGSTFAILDEEPPMISWI